MIRKNNLQNKREVKNRPGKDRQMMGNSLVSESPERQESEDMAISDEREKDLQILTAFSLREDRGENQKLKQCR